MCLLSWTRDEKTNQPASAVPVLLHRHRVPPGVARTLQWQQCQHHCDPDGLDGDCSAPVLTEASSFERLQPPRKALQSSQWTGPARSACGLTLSMLCTTKWLKMTRVLLAVFPFPSAIGMVLFSWAYRNFTCKLTFASCVAQFLFTVYLSKWIYRNVHRALLVGLSLNIPLIVPGTVIIMSLVVSCPTEGKLRFLHLSILSGFNRF